MALAISLIVTVLEMLNGFLSTDEEMVTMVRTFGADRRQVFTKVVMPSNLHTLFNSMKVNIGLSLVGGHRRGIPGLQSWAGLSSLSMAARSLSWIW